MKVLWVTNILFEHHLTMLGLDKSKVFGGSWLLAAYASSLGDASLQLHVVTVSNVKQKQVGVQDGNYFYILPGGGTRDYDIESKANISEWERIRTDIQPDVVVIWGTETRAAYLATKVMAGIPTAIYMQGVIASISEHYYEGVPYKYQHYTLRDLYDKFDVTSNYNHFKRQSLLEKEMLRLASVAIVENNWCEDICRVANPDIRIFRSKLPIRDVFYQAKWALEKMVPYKLFTNAGGYPIKGHHILFQALGKVKSQFPEFKCYIPGQKLSVFDGIKRRNGFTVYLNRLIQENNLTDNIIYTGPLPSEQMLMHLETCNAYVMPSIVENHSSSLIEAMIVGTPCVTSLVGGVADLVEHGTDALLYNSLDADSLAGSIIRLFTTPQLAASLGKKAYEIRGSRSGSFGEDMIKIYADMIK